MAAAGRSVGTVPVVVGAFGFKVEGAVAMGGLVVAVLATARGGHAGYARDLACAVSACRARRIGPAAGGARRLRRAEEVSAAGTAVANLTV